MPHTVWQQLWDNPANRVGGSRCPFANRKSLSRNAAQCREAPLDNPAPQCTIQTATFVAYCYCRGKTLPMPNPQRPCQENGERDNEIQCQVDVGSELCQAACVHHRTLLIYLLTCRHLSLSMYGCRECADLQPWRFVRYKDGQQQEKAPLCVSHSVKRLGLKTARHELRSTKSRSSKN